MARITTTTDGAPSAVSISETLRLYLREQDKFCDQLEAIADLLPESVNAQDCLLVAQNVVPMVKRVHDFEESTVFPLLERANATSAELKTSLERLKFEHIGDEDYANELCLALRDFVLRREHFNTESLAWMLRGFFQGLRRHVAFEREYILPLVEQVRH